MPKKPPMNAFALFMQERMPRMQRQGFHFPNGLKDVANNSVIQEEWKNLSSAERARFERMAKKNKEKHKLNLDNKFTTTGETYSAVQQRYQDQEMKKFEARLLFRKVVLCPKPTERNYIVVNVISSCDVSLFDGQGGKQALPLELAMAAFSIKHGLIQSYWTLINTGTAPDSCSSTCKETAMSTRLPEPGSKKFDKYPLAKDYTSIVSTIRSFIETWAVDYPQENKKPEYMIFGMDRDLPTIESSLDWLVKNENADDDSRDVEFFKALSYYSFPELLVELSSLAHELNPSFNTEISQLLLLGSAEKLLNKGHYEYRSEITCPYHKQGKNLDRMNLCCKNIVLRRVFLLLEEVTEPGFKCEMTNQHRINAFSPVDVSVPSPRTRETSASASPSSSATASGRTPEKLHSDPGPSRPSKSTVKRERSPSLDNGDNSHKRENSLESSGPSTFKVKRESQPIEEDSSPVDLKPFKPAGRGRGRGLRPRDLEEAKSRSVDTPVTKSVLSRGRGRAGPETRG